MQCLLRLAVISLALFALVLPAAAGGVIVPQQGMAGARIGMTKAQVRGALGAPLSIESGQNDFGAWTGFRYRNLVRVIFQSGNRVTAMLTTGRRERTASGVGVGSTRAQVLAGVRGVVCDGLGGGLGHCYRGSFESGRRVTDFFLRNGRVTRVAVGLVLD
jgi:hypothetical protein